MANNGRVMNFCEEIADDQILEALESDDIRAEMYI